MVYLTNTWTIFFFFVKLVYIPVHPGFIDILSFELQCHPSNAPESWGGHYHCSPTFLFLFFFQSIRKQSPSRLNQELVFLIFFPQHTHPHFAVGQRWEWRGEGCLYLLFLNKRVFLCTFLTADHPAWQALPQICPRSHSCQPSLSSQVPSQKVTPLISSRSSVNTPYLSLCITLSYWIIILLLFLSHVMRLNSLSTETTATFHNILPLRSNTTPEKWLVFNYVPMSCTSKTADYSTEPVLCCGTCHVQVGSRHPIQ